MVDNNILHGMERRDRVPESGEYLPCRDIVAHRAQDVSIAYKYELTAVSPTLHPVLHLSMERYVGSSACTTVESCRFYAAGNCRMD